MNEITIGQFTVGSDRPLAFFLGPCVIESLSHTLMMAEKIKEIAEKHSLHVVYKASFDKANRSSKDSFRGPGLDEGLKILQEVKKQFDLPVVSDIHTPEQAAIAAEVLDVLQIPAFLCRQTDLILAAGNTGKPISIKKGQFVAPLDMALVAEKVLSCGNDQVILTERGSSFGYNNLVADMRSIPLMQSLGHPVCFDATHSVQLPGGGKTSSGNREFIPNLAQAAVAAGCNMVFMECHNNPAEAKSDQMSVLPLEELAPLLDRLTRIHEALREKSYV